MADAELIIAMRWDLRASWYWWIAAAWLAVFLAVAPDYLHLSEVRRGILFWISLIATPLSAGAGVRAAIKGEGGAFRRGHARNMIALYGMIFCAIGFVACGVWYFWSSPSRGADSESENSAIAHLTELGWTVKPAPDSYSFEIVSKTLPPGKESAAYFEQIKRPFSLTLQSVNGLDGLHYLSGIANCVSITISAGEFSDVSELRGFSHLDSLTISQEPLNTFAVIDASVLSTMTNLTKLSLGMSKVRSVEFIASLKKLETVYLDGTLVSDLSPLANLPSLGSVAVRDAPATDLSPLATDKNLRELEISGSQVPGLTKLAALNSLRKLRLIQQGNVDLAPVAALKHLDSLMIMGLAEFDAGPISQLSGLHELSLLGFGFGFLSQVKDAALIGKLSELHTLTLANVLLSDFSFVGNLKNLTDVTLNYLPLQSVAMLSGDTALRKVTLVQTAVADVSPLFNLPSLTELNVMRSPVRSDQLSELERRGVKVTR